MQDFRDALLNRWPDHPLGVLGGRSLRQAAGDPAARVNVLAVILVMQQWSGRYQAEFDFNELRSQLGLPTLGPIEPQPSEIRTLPLVRLARVQLESLSDDDLVMAFHRGGMYHAWDAARKFARAVIDRPALPVAGTHGGLSASGAIGDDLGGGDGDIDEGRRNALSHGQSCAVWDLLELSFRFGHGDVDQAMQLMQHIESRHGDEPGVAQTLTQMLINVGLLNPDGTPVAMPGGRGAAGDAAPPAAAEPSKLWTPGSESAGSGGKLWIPGG